MGISNQLQSWKTRWSHPVVIAGLLSILMLARNLYLYWGYGFSFSPDSDLYVHTGQTLFQTWYVSPLVMFPYPLLNAVTQSYLNPAVLLVAQSLLGAIIGGFLVLTLARKNITLAVITGVMLALDLVWGSLTRTLLTDGLFATLNLLGLGLLVYQYDRMKQLSAWELVITGLLYGLILSTRPSNIFLIILLPVVYGWLSKSIRKVLWLAIGIAIFFLIVGLINLKGTQKFYILSGGESYTNDYLAYPLFIYRLYTPANGPNSAVLNQYLQACYPGLNYQEAVDHADGQVFDSTKNMDFILKQVFPCVKSQKESRQDTRSLFRSAYIESLTTNPLKFMGTISQELAVFLRYGNPYILPWQLNASNNYGCTGLAWCGQIQASRYQWNGSSPRVGLYEKVATKVLQAYLAPLGLVTALSPEKDTFPVLFCWGVVTLLLILFSRGPERALAVGASILALYTGLVVVAGLGFTERYAAMLSTVQTVLSAQVWYLLGKAIYQGWKMASPFSKQKKITQHPVPPENSF